MLDVRWGLWHCPRAAAIDLGDWTDSKGERLGGTSLVIWRWVFVEKARLVDQPAVVRMVEFEEDDPTIEGHGIQNDGQSCTNVVGIGPADAGPVRTGAGLCAFGGVGNEDGICSHEKAIVGASTVVMN